MNFFLGSKVNKACDYKSLKDAEHLSYVYRCKEAEEKLSKLKMALRKPVEMASPYYNALDKVDSILDVRTESFLHTISFDVSLL